MRIPIGVAKMAAAGFEGVRAVTRMEMPLSRDRVEFMTSNRAYDASRARTVLGFRAPTSLTEGIRRTVAWYKEKGWI
jgi:nucleoside-diphosphate-sugar epimerase